MLFENYTVINAAPENRLQEHSLPSRGEGVEPQRLHISSRPLQVCTVDYLNNHTCFEGLQ